MKLDILAFAAHPDDVELSCSGTLIKHIKAGKKVGIVDLTRGEMGTRGTPEQRDQEAIEASKIMGIHVRENLGLEDVYFELSKENKLKVVEMIRKYQPDIVLANAVTDRHPDHGKGADLLRDACFWSGLRKIETSHDGVAQEAWRPKRLFHYIQSNHIAPDFVVDVSDVWEQRMQSVYAFKSQFHTAETTNNDEPATFISSPRFIQFIEARAREMGLGVGVTYAEGFTVDKYLEIKDITSLI